VLTPRESIVRQIYKSHVQPFVRVVQGVSAFWDSSVATATNPSRIKLAVWSPCNRFIAISPGRSKPVDILDSATLQLLQSLEFPLNVPLESVASAFSPDSRTLTYLIRGLDHLGVGEFVVTWDLQTGGVVGAIEWKGPPDPRVGEIYITHSINGKVVAILSVYESSAIISIYDVVSSVHIHNVDHRRPTNPDLGLEVFAGTIWTHGASLRFAFLKPTGFTIREVGFTPGATVVEVETFSIPDNIGEMLSGYFPPTSAEFHPPSCRLAFVTNGRSLVVWDLQTSRFLLHEAHISSFRPFAFSSDGRFFACTTSESSIYIWRESSNGYTIVRKLIPSTTSRTRSPEPLLSPDGESIIAFYGNTIQLWHTKNSTTATSSVLPQALQNTGQEICLEFLSDEPLAVTARWGGRTITVVDLNSGLPQLTIDTSIRVYGLRAIANTIVAIGDQKAVTWNIPGGNFPPGARMNAEDKAHTIHFDQPADRTVSAASISLDSQYVAFLGYTSGEGYILDVSCTSTTKNLRIPLRTSLVPTTLWFAPGGHDLWCATENFEAEVSTITQGTLYHTRTVPGIEYGTWGCPWGSSCGHQITDEGWVFRRDGKRLLMLPPLWRSSFGAKEVVWNGKFLGLLHGALLEPVILELEP
jgi:WD40 repeat protein